MPLKVWFGPIQVVQQVEPRCQSARLVGGRISTAISAAPGHGQPLGTDDQLLRRQVQH